MRLNHKIHINKVVLCETPGLWDKYADSLWGAPALFFNTKFAFSFLLYSFITGFFTVNSLRGEPSLGHTGVPRQSYFTEGQCPTSPAKLLRFGWMTTGITKCPCFWYQYLIFMDITYLVMCIWGLEGPGQAGQIYNIKVSYIFIE